MEKPRTRDERLAEKMRQIKALMNYLNMPETRGQVEDLADSALHILAQPDQLIARMAIVMAAVAQSTKWLPNGEISAIADRNLFEWAAAQARELSA